MDKADQSRLIFHMLTEIGIIQQLVTTGFNKRLPDGLLISHFGVLNHLTRLGDGQAPHKIADAFQVSRASMSNTLDKLAKRQLIEERAHPRDGRSKLVYLTEKGTKARLAALEALEPELIAMGEEVDLERISRALPALVEIREYLDKRRT